MKTDGVLLVVGVKMDDKHKHIQLAEMERRVLNAQAELAEA